MSFFDDDDLDDEDDDADLNGTHVVFDDDEDSGDKEPEPCAICGQPFCPECMGCHTCEKDSLDYGPAIAICPLNVPDYLRVSTGL